jgi:general stress protein YciG
MSPERRRELGRKGGQSGPPDRRHFAQDKEAAKAAGRLGGLENAARRRKEAEDGGG